MKAKIFGKSVLFALLVVFLFICLSSLVLSLLLRFTDIQTSTLMPITTILTFVFLFIGGIISGAIRGTKGWFIGGVTGFLYSLIIFLFQYLGYGTVFSGSQTLFHLGFIVISMIGGILGVNTFARK